MEVFVDFGLFELAAAAGLWALARRLYGRKVTAALVLVVSVLAPAALVFMASSEVTRWLSVSALATALINASVVVALLRNGGIPVRR
jgi:hypothetical protein